MQEATTTLFNALATRGYAKQFLRGIRQPTSHVAFSEQRSIQGRGRYRRFFAHPHGADLLAPPVTVQ